MNFDICEATEQDLQGRLCYLWYISVLEFSVFSNRQIILAERFLAVYLSTIA